MVMGTREMTDVNLVIPVIHVEQMDFFLIREHLMWTRLTRVGLEVVGFMH
jgi:hypothetical protein